MFQDTVFQLIAELQGYKRDRSTLYPSYIQHRLEKSLQSYYEQLQKSAYYLKYNNTSKRSTILKELNKEDE